ncbi:hypothetical protein [Auritidibacter ignavus]|uniref:hypothetical protein n=1 Tax=Auritidibacter ignavus TaxID=678932 RepID=UPI00109D785B|nr:hypothetical protein [Auritidibacter ignavus]
MLSHLTTLGSGPQIVNELPVEPWAYGVAVFVILMCLLFATMSLRSVRRRHQAPGSEVVTRDRAHQRFDQQSGH